MAECLQYIILYCKLAKIGLYSGMAQCLQYTVYYTLLFSLALVLAFRQFALNGNYIRVKLKEIDDSLKMT